MRPHDQLEREGGERCHQAVFDVEESLSIHDAMLARHDVHDNARSGDRCAEHRIDSVDDAKRIPQRLVESVHHGAVALALAAGADVGPSQMQLSLLALFMTRWSAAHVSRHARIFCWYSVASSSQLAQPLLAKRTAKRTARRTMGRIMREQASTFLRER